MMALSIHTLGMMSMDRKEGDHGCFLRFLKQGRFDEYMPRVAEDTHQSQRILP